MLRRLLLLTAALLGIRGAAAQDTILLRTAEEIQVLVTEITDSEVRYRSFGQEGPVRVVSRADVFSITYANGDKELFAAKGGSDGSYPWPRISRAYRVGELFDEQGVRGLVVHTTDGGNHGLIISLYEGRAMWGGAWGEEQSETFQGFACYCRSEEDGWKNMQAIAELLDHVPGLSWSNFPAFDWCRKQGPGWYLPASGEMELLWAFGGTGTVREMHRATFDTLELLLTGVGGQRLRRMYMYWTSTENSDDPTEAVRWGSLYANPKTPPVWRKEGEIYLRAFHKF